jgi:hypothetical protein
MRHICFVAFCALAACGGSDVGNSVPMTLTVQVVTPSQVQLDWTPYNGGGDFYAVYRNGTIVGTEIRNATRYTDVEVDPGTQYCYIVHRWGYLGSIGRSNTVCIATPVISGWDIQTVGKGSNPSLALDPANRPHISVRNLNGVILAVQSGDVWQYSAVDAEAGDFGDTDVGVDRNGANHLSYWDYGNDRLKVATDATGVWFTDVVNSGGSITALALDGAGSSHILYDIPGAGSINYITNQTGTWVKRVLAGFANATLYDSDILVDATGVVHAVFAIGNVQACSVHYLTNPGGQWSEQLIANDSNCGAALARDTAGVVHVVYSTPFGLRHTRYAGGMWQAEQVDDFGRIGGDSVAMAIDGANYLHVAYRDQNFDLQYATNSSGAWEFACVDSSGRMGFDMSIAVDPMGQISIAYADQTRGTVKLATSP